MFIFLIQYPQENAMSAMFQEMETIVQIPNFTCLILSHRENFEASLFMIVLFWTTVDSEFDVKETVDQP